MNVKKIKGFTLIELMVVVAIIAILAAIAIPAIFRYRIDANRAKCVGNMKQIQNAVEAVRIVKGTQVPADLDDTIFKGTVAGEGYWVSAPVCPANGTYDMSSVNSATWKPSCTKSEAPEYHTFESAAAATATGTN